MDEVEILRAAAEVEIPTLGHFLEHGFCDPRIRLVGPAPRMTGSAFTVDLTVPDAIAVNRALVEIRSGDVLVIRVEGGRHAPVGAVTIAAAVAQGAAGVVVDGPVTDLSALRSSGIPVYATGSTALTTKLLGSSEPKTGGIIMIGGIRVRHGDLILGDENGILVLPPGAFTPDVLERARQSDAAEPELLRRIGSGAPLVSLLALTASSDEVSAQKAHSR